VPEEELKVTIRLKDFATRGMKKFHGTVTRVAAKVRAKLGAVKSAVFGLKGALIALGGTVIAKSFLDAGAQLEKFRTQLVAVMNQNEKLADSTLKWVRDFAALTPHATADVIQSFVSLQAAGVQASKQMMSTIGNVAYVFDRNIADVSLGLVSMEKEIFKRLGIQWEIVGRKAKIWSGDTIVHTDKAAESMRKGILEIWEKKFPGAMKRAEGDYKGLIELLKSQWWEYRANVMQAGVMDFIKEGLKVAAAQMTATGNSSTKMADTIISGMKNAALFVGAVADGYLAIKMAVYKAAIEVKKYIELVDDPKGFAQRQLDRLEKGTKTLVGIYSKIRGLGREDQGKLNKALDQQVRIMGDFFGLQRQEISDITLMENELADIRKSGVRETIKGWITATEHALKTKKEVASVHDAYVRLRQGAVEAARGLDSPRQLKAPTFMGFSVAELKKAHDQVESTQHTMMLNYGMLREHEAAMATAAEETNQKLQQRQVIIEDTRPHFDALRVQFENFAGIIGSSIVGAIDDAIEGTFRWQDALKGLMKDLGLAITRMLIMQGIRAVGGAIGGLGSVATSDPSGLSGISSFDPAMAMAKGGYVGSGVHIPRAQRGRGVIKGPQLIYAGDNTTGDNEEYIMPAVKGPDGTLGVKGHGGGVTINVSAVDEDGVAKFFYKHRDKLMSMFNLGMTESPGMTPAGG
jgi:hypothetical protein